MKIKEIPNVTDLRGKTESDGKYKVYDVTCKTDIAIHHSLTDEGDSASFARYHVRHQHWPGIAYHFVILKDGTIEWNHDLGVMSFHVGKANKQAIGICLVGDFRYYEPTRAQKRSLRRLHTVLKMEMVNYERTRGHNEFLGYEWKSCPCFDYRAVLEEKRQEADVKRFRLMTGIFQSAEELVNGKKALMERYSWTLYERADHTHFNPPFRIVTGTFITQEEAEKHAKDIEESLGWKVYVIDA
ncbi:peptidoglycan recognition family protein [Pontibacillus sp. HMF3514]|uniref:peptidoglycan recognition protein family protein n=1 Tax=Pontibacillus sp. HMF3514 TaxID=2692425 RepID=UPI00131F5DA5|nr:peptidoglycan recognition family protein [Pontibacillus sp. HMF3514]QHE51102.1 hypothetical protein GS400_03160 [Pontibacillus sp. HMF3514]